MSVLTRTLRSIGFRLIEASDHNPGNPAYSPDSEYGYACGATLIHDLLNNLLTDDSSVIERVYMWDSGKKEMMYEEALDTVRKAGIPLVETRGAVPRNYSRGRKLNFSAEFRKWKDELQPGDHVILDHPAEIGTVGAITRTSLAFGIRDIAIIEEKGVDTFDPLLIRASMGTRFQVRMEVFPDIMAYRARFPENQIVVFQNGNKMADPIEPEPGFSLVVGAEDTILPDQYGEFCRRISISGIAGDADLSPSVAAAIILCRAQNAGSMEGMV